MRSLRFCTFTSPFSQSLFFFSPRKLPCSSPRLLLRNPRTLASTLKTTDHSNGVESPLSGMEEVFMGYLFGRKRATEVAHLVWKHVLRKGDMVVDATCGNGHDTLAMLKMVSDETGSARVYGMDVQKDALARTSLLLSASVSPCEKELVKLFDLCHSRIGEIVPEGAPLRLVAFNLGYLPGGDKALTTTQETTVLAMEAAKRLLVSGGLISMVVYIGHPGGREEYEAVEAFASGLSADNWCCCKFQMLNRPLAPILIMLCKK